VNDEQQPPKLKLLEFRHDPPADFTRVGPPEGYSRYGIYPLREDVILTLDVFNVLLWELEQGSAESRRMMASTLRTTYTALFVAPKPKIGV